MSVSVVPEWEFPLPGYPFDPPLPRLSIAVGVGHSWASLPSDGRTAALGESDRFQPVPHSAVGVGQDEEPLPPMGRGGLGRRKQVPFRIEPA